MTKKTAGGRATESGMGFQAYVTTWFAAQMLADAPVGQTFGLRHDLKIDSLQCETGDAMDDVVLRLSDGGVIYVQAKTRPYLTDKPDTLLGKAIAQLADLYRHLSDAARADDCRAVLAVAEGASGNLSVLETACRRFDRGGVWAGELAAAPDSQRDALEKFETLIRHAWTELGAASAPTDGDLVGMARLLHIRRFSDTLTGSDWTAASQMLGDQVYGGAANGAKVMRDLLAEARELIRTGAPADRLGLLKALRKAGTLDVASPAFQSDIDKLKQYSAAERSRLDRHTELPLATRVPIPRDCLAPLAAAVSGGSLLVTGAPGAGKTGVLLALAKVLEQGPGPVLFLSVERFSGFTRGRDLQDELRLAHDPLQVLAAWPGSEPGVLILDALDASRGGPSEAVIAAFISDAVAQLGARWSVVASIRSFDLRNGRRFREIMAGPPPDPTYAERDMTGVRHFRIPELTRSELTTVAALSTELGALLAEAGPLQELLTNVFNLSLAADLLRAGVPAQTIRSAKTQSQLIQAYEDERIRTQPARRAAGKTISKMVERRRLTVLATEIDSDTVGELQTEGVLVAAGDLVAFAHHVLFDHVASRFYLIWNDPEVLRAQVSGQDGVGMLLGPALRFALESLWQMEPDGPNKTWSLIRALTADEAADPVVVSIALRTAAERVASPDDVAALIAFLSLITDADGLGRLFGQLARFLGLVTRETNATPLTAEAASAWALVAKAAAQSGAPQIVDAGRVLLMALAEAGPDSDQTYAENFGAAARSLLTAAWTLTPYHGIFASSGIRFVARSYGSDPAASRALLQQLLDVRLAEHAADEAPWLAEGIEAMSAHDPAFVAEIYGTLFNHQVTDEEKTWVGGSASRILPLTSTRKQDFQHARWRLTEGLKAFLASQPAAGAVAVVGAVHGLVAEDRRRGRNLAAPTCLIAGRPVQICDDWLSLQDWRTRDSHTEDVLIAFVEALRAAPPAAFRTIVEAVSRIPANASVWARILGVAADRPDVADDLLWPIATEPRFAVLQGLSRDAVIYLAATYARRSLVDREVFETAALGTIVFEPETPATAWDHILGRLLSEVEATDLATPAIRDLQEAKRAAGDLTGNRPYLSIETGWRSTDDIVDSMLRDGGVNLEAPPQRDVRAASRRVEDQVRSGADTASSPELAELWSDVVALVAILDATPDIPETLAHSSWGAVCNGLEQIARGEVYTPGEAGHPPLNDLLALIDRLAVSRWPEGQTVSGADSSLLAWGNWDVRVYAASSLVALAPRFASGRMDIVSRMATVLDDPEPTVRLQVAQAANVLWDADRAGMWSLIDKIAAQETHVGVLRAFMGGPLQRVVGGAPDRIDRILADILDATWAAHAEESDGLDAEAAAELAARLFIAYDQPLAWSWIERWAGDLQRGEPYLGGMLHSLRGVFFFAYRPDVLPADLAMFQRSHRLVQRVVDAAASAWSEARPHLLGSPSPEAIERWRPSYLAADRLIDAVCNQLYFGSGAFRNGGDREAPGLPDVGAKQRFLVDYGQVLDVLAARAQARTVHNLIDLFAFLAEGDPPGVFDRVTRLLLGSGADDGYQFESLGADGLVALVRRYLADYRGIFETPERRQTLVDVLKLFSSAGWPEALKLLFELPDLLR